ncbi:MAG: transcriptional regulator, HxlR family [Candidatus Saccharibacteria bacterium]|nr:transcriptional regulator, HxlR family [Candidatus Saccharibacteria bacterium]
MVRKENESILQAGCSSNLVLSIIASRWTVMVLHALQQDTKRYSDITRAIPGITQKVLTDTLRKLERNGIVERIVYPVVPPKVEYKLTDLGHTLFTTTEMLAAWAETNGHMVLQSRDLYDAQLETLTK